MGDHMILSALITCSIVKWLLWLICCVKRRVSYLQRRHLYPPDGDINTAVAFYSSCCSYQCLFAPCLWSCKLIWQETRGVCVCVCLPYVCVSAELCMSPPCSDWSWDHRSKYTRKLLITDLTLGLCPIRDSVFGVCSICWLISIIKACR